MPELMAKDLHEIVCTDRLSANHSQGRPVDAPIEVDPH